MKGERMLYFRIQEDTGTPAYQQIVDAICDAVRDGRLGVGDQLPTENEMAAMLGVSRPTVSRGYERLQLMGVLAQTRIFREAFHHRAFLGEFHRIQIVPAERFTGLHIHD